LGALVVLATLVACSHGRSSAPAAPKTTTPARPEHGKADARLIKQADAELAAGIAELAQGHFNKARESFDRAPC
jgi:hypothetical protein